MRSVVVKYEEKKQDPIGNHIENHIKSHIVGELNFAQGKWIFRYSNEWQDTFKMELDFDLRFDCVNESCELFPFFLNRIPERESPVFLRAVKIWDLTNEEINDEMSLLVTVAHRDVTHFVLDPKNFAPGKWK